MQAKTSRGSAREWFVLIEYPSWHLRQRRMSRAPTPVANLRHVVAMLADVELVPLDRRPVTCCCVFHLAAESWNSPDRVERELIAVEIVQHGHVKGRRGGAFFPEAADVNIIVVVPPVSQLVNHRGIAVEGKDHRLVGREQFIKILIFEP